MTTTTPHHPVQRSARGAAALLLGAALLAAAPMAARAADYTLAPGAQVSFVSTKAGKVAEVHHFNEVTGSLDGDGNARIAIALASVDTAIAIRNERMREMLFEVADFPQAVIEAELDPATYGKLGPGQYTTLDVPATLALHGEEHTLALTLDVTAAADGSLLVASRRPVIVNAADYRLAAGVEKLREVAGLPSISPAVPVTFSLRFQAN